jgi:hypothetical protein
MELIFGLAVLYPVFLVALHVPMLSAYFVLKRHRLLSPRDFAFTCAAVFGVGHAIAVAVIRQGWPGIVLPAVGAALGVVCGLVWWYILVKRIGVDDHSQGKVSAA